MVYSGFGCFHEITHPFIMGIYQTRESIDTYKKNTYIYVVENHNDVMLQAILFYPKAKCDTKNLEFDKTTLFEHFKNSTKNNSIASASASTSANASTSSANSNNSNSKAAVRLMKEFKSLKENKTLPFEFSLQNDQLNRWTIEMHRRAFEDQTSDLVQDMKKYNIDAIKFEALFSDKYPFHPPFIRVVSPRFQYQTGHITSGGSICMEILCIGHWTPVCNLESLMIQIKVLIIEGGARIDPVHWNKEYSQDEAEKSFIRVAKGHGWM